MGHHTGASRRRKMPVAAGQRLKNAEAYVQNGRKILVDPHLSGGTGRRVMHRFLISLLIVWACVYAPAQQTQVYPRIETGAHSARANRIDTDLSGHYLFSASLDKTARVWDLRTGRLLKTLRPPMG